MQAKQELIRWFCDSFLKYKTSKYKVPVAKANLSLHNILFSLKIIFYPLGESGFVEQILEHP